MKTIEEIIEAKKVAEAKINNIIAQFAHDNEQYDIDVNIQTTKLFTEGSNTAVGVGASTKIKIVL